MVRILWGDVSKKRPLEGAMNSINEGSKEVSQGRCICKDVRDSPSEHDPEDDDDERRGEVHSNLVS